MKVDVDEARTVAMVSVAILIESLCNIKYVVLKTMNSKMTSKLCQHLYSSKEGKR